MNYLQMLAATPEAITNDDPVIQDNALGDRPSVKCPTCGRIRPGFVLTKPTDDERLQHDWAEWICDADRSTMTRGKNQQENENEL